MTVEEAAPAPEIQAANNYPLIVASGIAAALVGAVLWAVVSAVTGMELGLMAIVIGLLVGLAIQKVRKHREKALGWTGAGLALAGCVIGNALTLVAFVSQKYGVSYDQTLMRTGTGGMLRLMAAGFEPMDLLFYAIAVYEGFKFSNR